MFPTINLMCTHTIFSWLNLRKIFLDYGLNYMKRETAIVSYFLITLSVAAFYVILVTFKIINSNLYMVTYTN